jgi:hypothetical protein
VTRELKLANPHATQRDDYAGLIFFRLSVLPPHVPFPESKQRDPARTDRKISALFCNFGNTRRYRRLPTFQPDLILFHLAFYKPGKKGHGGHRST